MRGGGAEHAGDHCEEGGSTLPYYLALVYSTVNYTDMYSLL